MTVSLKPIVRFDPKWQALREEMVVSDPVVCLGNLLPEGLELSHELVAAYIGELQCCRELKEHYESYWQSPDYRHIVNKSFEAKFTGVPLAGVLFCYVLIRLLKPAKVLETGCASGWISAIILQALHFNQKGHLYSIDLPPVEGKLSMNYTLPGELKSGFLVPDSLKGRWTLFSSDIRSALMPLLHELGAVDFFYHDSNHTYLHMMWEYSSVWPHLSEGGVLVSDDIGWNVAFSDFARALKLPLVISQNNPNMGALCKRKTA